MTASFSNGPDSYLPQSPPFFTLNVSFWTGSIHAPLYSLYSSIMAFAGRQVKTMGRKLYTYCWMGIICFCERFSQWNSFSRPVLLSNCIFQRVIIQSVFRIYCYVGQFNKNCPLFVFCFWAAIKIVVYPLMNCRGWNVIKKLEFSVGGGGDWILAHALPVFFFINFSWMLEGVRYPFWGGGNGFPLPSGGLNTWKDPLVENWSK